MLRSRVPIFFTLLMALALRGVFGQSADQLYAGGRQAFTDSLWPTAASQFSRLLREYPEDHRADSAAYMGAVAYYNAGEYQRSIELLSAFPRRYPDSAWNRRVAYWEGLARYDSGDWRNAAVAFERQIAMPEEPSYRDRSLLYLGACRENLGYWDAAETAYLSLISESRDYETSARAVFRLGQIRLSDDRPAEALEAFNRLAFNYPGSPLASDIEYWIGESQRRMGRDSAALESYRNYLSTVYDSQYRVYALLEAARLASRAGKDEEALAYLDVRDEERPRGSDEGYGTVVRIRALSYLRSGMLEEAREAYLRILDNPVDAGERQSASFDLAQTWLGTSGVLNAVPWLDKASKGPDPRISADALYTAGQILLVEGELKGANSLETFTRQFPEDSRREEALRLIVKARRDSGDSDRALKALDSLVLDYPDSSNIPSYLFLRAEMALEEGDETSALRDFGRISDSYESSGYAIEAHSRIGFIYSGRGEHIRASGHYLEAARISGGVQGGEVGRRAIYSAGIAFLNGRNLKQAVELFGSLVESDPRGPWGVEAAYHMGEALYDEGDYTAARQAYESAARHGDDRWAYEAAYASGWTWFRESEWVKAVAAFERSFEVAVTDEQRARSRYRVGLSLASSGDWESALSHYRPALDYGPSSWREEALYQYAWALLNLDQEGEAFVIADLIAEEFPESDLPADLPFRMGENAMSSGEYALAVQWYDRCISRYPNSSVSDRAELRAALASRENGDAPEAAERYGSWISSHPDDPGVTAASRSWAEALKESGSPDLAVKAKEQVLQIDPDYQSLAVPVLLAWARISGVPADSAGYLDDIAENETLPSADRADALLLRAHLYRNEGRYGRSRQIYEVIIRDIPGRIGAEAQEGLARSYADEGRIDDAAEAYLAVPYLYPDESDLAARSLREAERLYREAGRTDEADKIRARIEGN